MRAGRPATTLAAAAAATVPPALAGRQLQRAVVLRRDAPDAAVVRGRQVWDLCSLGALFCSRLWLRVDLEVSHHAQMSGHVARLFRLERLAHTRRCVVARRRNMYVNGSKENKHMIETYGPDFGYKDLVPLFTAPKFNASAWAAIYARAGARYAGPVAEHADGFAMFKSQISHWNAAEMGPKHDIVGELAKEIRAQGLRLVTTMHHQWLFAWYPTWDASTDAGDPQYELTADQGGLYGPKVGNNKCFGGDLTTLKSPSHPAGCDVSPRFNDYFNGKVREVVDQYQPDLLYFDAKMDWIDEVSTRLRQATRAGCTHTAVLPTLRNPDLSAGWLYYHSAGRPIGWSFSRTTTTPLCNGRRT